MSKFYRHPYYLCNLLLCLIYPITRYFGISSSYLNIRDSFGFQKETQIVTGILVMVVIRYIRYYSNLKQFMAEALFYFKIGTILILFFINFRLFAWYGFLCIVLFILFKIPGYEGPTNVKNIQLIEHFDQIILKKNKDISAKDFYWIVIFYSTFSDLCKYTEELWAKVSLNYTTPALNFAGVDVDGSADIAAKYKVINSGIHIQLPILVLIKNGEEVKRYPWNDKNGKPLKVKFYKEKEIIKYFDLEDLYHKTNNVLKKKAI